VGGWGEGQIVKEKKIGHGEQAISWAKQNLTQRAFVRGEGRRIEDGLCRGDFNFGGCGLRVVRIAPVNQERGGGALKGSGGPVLGRRRTSKVIDSNKFMIAPVEERRRPQYRMTGRVLDNSRGQTPRPNRMVFELVSKQKKRKEEEMADVGWLATVFSACPLALGGSQDTMKLYTRVRKNAAKGSFSRGGEKEVVVDWEKGAREGEGEGYNARAGIGSKKEEV